jgi:NitT/TauT family transport system permease protein
MIPKITFAPIFVTWFGFGYLPKLIIVFLVCFFPILLNGILAFSSLPTELDRLCRSTGASGWRTFRCVRLQAALPQLFVGIKGAAINATVGATISEWIGGDAGLGYYIQIATGDLRMDLAFAIIIVLALLGLALFGAVALIERALIPWHISQRGEPHRRG